MIVRQLAFPWCPLTRVLVEDLAGDLPVRVELAAGGAEVELVLRAPPGGAPGDAWRHAERLVIRVSLARPAGCALQDRPHWWSFETHDHHGDAFDAAIEWGLARLDAGIGRRDDWDTAMARRDQHRRSLSRLTTLAATLAWERCADPARAVALAFPPPARSFVYAALLADDRGRVAQMVETCPALLVLAAGRVDTWSLVRRIDAGEPLRDLLAGVIAPAVGGAGAAHACALVRRAPAGLDRTVLIDAVAAPGIDRNDMPGGAKGHGADRRVWFRWAATWRRVASRWPLIDGPAFGSFVSRHALVLDAIALDEQTDAHTLLDAVLDWVTAVGPVPTRRSSPRRVLARMAAWHQDLWAPKLDPGVALRTGPLVAAAGATASVIASPIATVGELVEEGRAMRHCVASLADRGVTGELAFYRATIEGERLTVAVAAPPVGGCDPWRLVEASGDRNTPPSGTARRALERWVELFDGAVAVRTPQSGSEQEASMWQRVEPARGVPEKYLQTLFEGWATPPLDRLFGVPGWMASLTSVPIRAQRTRKAFGYSFTPDIELDAPSVRYVLELKRGAKYEPLALAEVLHHAAWIRRHEPDPAAPLVVPVIVASYNVWLRLAIESLHQDAVRYYEAEVLEAPGGGPHLVLLDAPLVPWVEADAPPWLLEASAGAAGLQWHHVVETDAWFGLRKDRRLPERPAVMTDAYVLVVRGKDQRVLVWEGRPDQNGAYFLLDPGAPRRAKAGTADAHQPTWLRP